MKRFAFVLALFALFVNIHEVEASLVYVNKEGETVIKVLSQETVSLEVPAREFEVKEAGDTNIADATISLYREGEKVKLLVENGDQKEELNIEKTKETLVEVEERPEVKRLVFGVSDGKFTLREGGVTATTNFPLKVDAETAKIAVTTETGERYISILPHEALEGPLRAKIIDRLNPTDLVELAEEESSLYYNIAGQKDINFFNVYTYSFPVKSKVSASSGEILEVDPVWLKVFDILFS